MTDITEHPTREGKIYCCVVLHTFRRRSGQDGLVIHSDRGVQFTSWAFSQNVRDVGLAPSMGAVGSPYDNAMVESFWGRVQVELLNRQGWKTRIELANAIHDYIELFHNTRRRHSSLNMLTPTEFEDLHQHPTNAG
jgi:putative transposase